MAQRSRAARKDWSPAQPGGRSEGLSTTPPPSRRTSSPSRRPASGCYRIRRRRPLPPAPSAAWSALIAIATFGMLLLGAALINR